MQAQIEKEKWFVRGSRCKVKFSTKEYLKPHALLKRSPLSEIYGAECVGLDFKSYRGGRWKIQPDQNVLPETQE